MAQNELSSVRLVRGIRLYRVVILGDGGVGKSALTMQFVKHQFLDYHDPTIEDAYQQQIVIDGEAAQLDILDTAGQPEFTAMREQYMRNGEGFVICYSITDKRSFEEAIMYKRLVDKVRARDDMPIVLVGNKCDLQSDRKVLRDEGESLAGQFRCPFYETSAAYRTCVDEVFQELIREIRQYEQNVGCGKQLRKQKRTNKLALALSGVFKKAKGKDGKNK